MLFLIDGFQGKTAAGVTFKPAESRSAEVRGRGGGSSRPWIAKPFLPPCLYPLWFVNQKFSLSWLTIFRHMVWLVCVTWKLVFQFYLFIHPHLKDDFLLISFLEILDFLRKWPPRPRRVWRTMSWVVSLCPLWCVLGLCRFFWKLSHSPCFLSVSSSAPDLGVTACAPSSQIWLPILSKPIL